MPKRRHDSLKTSKYKTSICTFFIGPDGCPFGDKCAFAHSESELRQESDPIPVTPRSSVCNPLDAGECNSASESTKAVSSFGAQMESNGVPTAVQTSHQEYEQSRSSDGGHRSINTPPVRRTMDPNGSSSYSLSSAQATHGPRHGNGGASPPVGATDAMGQQVITRPSNKRKTVRQWQHAVRRIPQASHAGPASADSQQTSSAVAPAPFSPALFFIPPGVGQHPCFHINNQHVNMVADMAGGVGDRRTMGQSLSTSLMPGLVSMPTDAYSMPSPSSYPHELSYDGGSSSDHMGMHPTRVLDHGSHYQNWPHGAMQGSPVRSNVIMMPCPGNGGGTLVGGIGTDGRYYVPAGMEHPDRGGHPVPFSPSASQTPNTTFPPGMNLPMGYPPSFTPSTATAMAPMQSHLAAWPNITTPPFYGLTSYAPPSAPSLPGAEEVPSSGIPCPTNDVLAPNREKYLPSSHGEYEPCDVISFQNLEHAALADEEAEFLANEVASKWGSSIEGWLVTQPNDPTTEDMEAVGSIPASGQRSASTGTSMEKLETGMRVGFGSTRNPQVDTTNLSLDLPPVALCGGALPQLSPGSFVKHNATMVEKTATTAIHPSVSVTDGAPLLGDASRTPSPYPAASCSRPPTRTMLCACTCEGPSRLKSRRTVMVNLFKSSCTMRPVAHGTSGPVTNPG